MFSNEKLQKKKRDFITSAIWSAPGAYKRLQTEIANQASCFDGEYEPTALHLDTELASIGHSS